MRWRGGIGIGIAIGIALLAMGVIPSHYHVPLPSQSRGSTAATPVAFVQITSFAQTVRSHSGVGDRDQNAGSLRFASGLIGTLAAAVQVVEKAVVIDGPLYRRPPPQDLS